MAGKQTSEYLTKTRKQLIWASLHPIIFAVRSQKSTKGDILTGIDLCR